MDGQYFDDLARLVSGGANRRGVLRALAAGIAAAAAGLFGPGDAGAATCRKAGEICRKNGDCCSDNCGPKDRTGRQRCDRCPDGSAICDGACCAAGSSCNNGSCCAHACGDECCGSGETCVDGGCCPSDLVCNGRFCCAETSICTVDVCCASDDVCSAGGRTFCCGSGTSCNEDGCIRQCENGTCRDAGDCAQGRTCCDGCCVDTASDDDHCGGCGIDCGISVIDPDGLPNACCNGVCSTIPVCIE